MGLGFTKNVHRVDPYKGFKFTLEWDGKVILLISKIGALTRTTESVPYRSGGDNSHETKSPGRTSYSAITIERGITHSTEFEEWANKIHHYSGDELMDLVNYKKELTITLHNESGQSVLQYFLHGCWVSEFTAMPELDASQNAIVYENIKIELEGWERDINVTEPTEEEKPPQLG